MPGDAGDASRRGAVSSCCMGTIKDEVVVLRRLDFSESSEVLALFGREHGKVRAIAKGVRRSTKTRFAIGVDLLDVGHVVLSVRSVHQEALAIVAEWKQSRAFSGLRMRLDRLYAAQYAGMLASELTEDWDPHPRLFDALVGLFQQLNEAAECLPHVIRFQRVLLREIGSLPEFDRCVGCGRAVGGPGVHFSSFEGGLLCRDCEPARTEKYEVPAAALDWLRNGAGADRAATPAYRTLDYHLSHIMGRRHPLGAALLNAARAT